MTYGNVDDGLARTLEGLDKVSPPAIVEENIVLSKVG
jgi:hypothetical protein